MQLAEFQALRKGDMIQRKNFPSEANRGDRGPQKVVDIFLEDHPPKITVVSCATGRKSSINVISSKAYDILSPANLSQVKQQQLPAIVCKVCGFGVVHCPSCGADLK